MKKRAIITVGCSLLLLAALPEITPAQTDVPGQIRLDAADGPDLARQLLRRGQPRIALQIIETLLNAERATSEIHLLHGQILMRLGENEKAREAARTAWRTATTRRDRFSAAFAMADFLAADEHYTRSQLWVRRAVQSAPDARSVQLATDAFQRVRRVNPLAVELELGISPSDNVNSGNSNDTITFAYLPGVLSELEFLVPEDQRPLSGVEISAQTRLRYRIAETETSRTSLDFGVFGRTYIMSDSARETAPEVTGESLSYVQLSFGAIHQWATRADGRPTSLSVTYNHDWLGGSPYRQEIDVNLGTQYRLANDDTLAVSISGRFTDRFSTSDDVFTSSARTQWTRGFDNNDSLSVLAQVANATSNATDLSYLAGTLGIVYDFGDIGFGVDLATSLTHQYRDYETSVFDPAGRVDNISSVRLDMGFDTIEFYGFQPVVNVTGRRTTSSVPRFETEGLQMGLNLRSSF